MAKLTLPDNFASISMRERYAIMLEEFYDVYSVNDLIEATFVDLKEALDEQHQIKAPVESFIPIMKAKVLELCVNLMSSWVKNDIFEDAAEIQMYFPNAVLTDAQLEQINFIEICGPAVHSYAKFALRDHYFDKYINRPEVANYLMDYHGLDVKTL